jgi:hypothetical protein
MVHACTIGEIVPATKAAINVIIRIEIVAHGLHKLREFLGQLIWDSNHFSLLLNVHALSPRRCIILANNPILPQMIKVLTDPQSRFDRYLSMGNDFD